jgi:hypothetical protein
LGVINVAVKRFEPPNRVAEAAPIEVDPVMGVAKAILLLNNTPKKPTISFLNICTLLF